MPARAKSLSNNNHFHQAIQQFYKILNISMSFKKFAEINNFMHLAY